MIVHVSLKACLPVEGLRSRIYIMLYRYITCLDDELFNFKYIENKKTSNIVGV